MRNFSFLYLSLFVLYGAVGYFSFGYDDEFFNINLVENLGLGIVEFTQATDVHPPGSYFIDWLLFATLGKWELVRLVISLMTAASLIYATESIRTRYGERSGVFLFTLLGLNPAILLWCTGIRWYAFFVPVLIWLSIVPRQKDLRWAKCFGGLLCLGYLSYAVFVVALPVLLIYWMESEQVNREKVASVLKYGVFSLILYSHQLFVFLSVHIKNKESQVFSLSKNLTGFVVAQIGNQGVFPLSVPGLIAGAATLGAIATIFYSNSRTNLKNGYFISYSLCSGFAIFSGLAGKIRNLVVVSPWQVFWIATAKIETPQKTPFLIFIALLTISNLWGVHNVVSHQNTTKNSWNLPVKQVLEDLNAEKSKCGNDLIVLSHDPTLSWHLDRAGYQVLGPYSPSVLPQQVLASTHNCLILLRTFAGSISQPDYQRMLEELKFLDHAGSEYFAYGRDDFYVLKNRLDSRYPEYMVEVTKYYGISNLAALRSWQPTDIGKR